MSRIELAAIAQARCGDKADLATLSLFAPSQELHSVFCREVTTERVAALFGTLVGGPIDRYELDSLLAVHFVLHRALDGGSARSLRYDRLGKSYAALLLRLVIDIDSALLPERLRG